MLTHQAHGPSFIAHRSDLSASLCKAQISRLSLTLVCFLVDCALISRPRNQAYKPASPPALVAPSAP